jgi:thymidylate kinase
MQKTPIIVFEGPDNCGKSTQLSRIIGKINSERPHIKCHNYKFPNYDSMYGNRIKYMLNHKDEYDLRGNICDMDLFSELQINDKLLLLYYFDESCSNDNVCYCFLDRYTLSSRIYDAVSRALLPEGKDEDDLLSILDYKPKYSNGIYIEDTNKQITDRITHFIKTYVYDPHQTYVNNKYLADRIALGYGILEHKCYDIKHVYFRSCKALERLASKERELDQYEDDDIFKKIINTIYNFIPNYHHGDKGPIPLIASNKSWIVIDTTLILTKVLHLGTKEDGLSEKDEGVMYRFCRDYPDASLDIVTREATNALYEILD